MLVRIIFLISVHLSFALNVFSQPTAQWIQKFGSPLNDIDIGYVMVLDDSANVYVAGKIAMPGGADFAVLKYNTNGTLLWDTSYNGTGNWIDEANLIAIDKQHNVYVAGKSKGVGSDYDYCAIKYSVNGIPLWVRSYNGPSNTEDIPNALAIDTLGNVYVTGMSGDTNIAYGFATIKYSPNGTSLWVRRFQGPLGIEASAYAIAVDDSGNVYVGGEGTLSSNNADYVLIKYDSSGTMQWVSYYDGGNDYDQIVAIALGDSGHIYVTGTSNWNISPGNIGVATIKYNSVGDSIWVRRYDVWYDNYPNAMVLDKNENIYIAGWAQIVALWDSTNYLTLKYDSAGNFQWDAIYNGAADRNDIAYAIAVSDSGNVYVTGQARLIANSSDYVTIKYDSSGIQQWLISYDGLANSFDGGYSIKIDLLENVYVTGFAMEVLPSDLQIVTIKYSYFTGIDENENTSGILVFPNPSPGKFYIKGINKAEIEVYNVLGEKVYSKAGNEIDMSSEPNGVYFVNVKTGDKIISKKLVIDK